MVPSVDKAVNDGACSPIKGMRMFRFPALLNGLPMLPPCLNKLKIGTFFQWNKLVNNIA
jgi:hypothetical protein